jgi:NarL family two-component system response regulator LiaR
MEEGGTMPNVAPSSVDADEKRGDLNPLQQRIVALTISGYSSQDIAKRLGISVPAAKRHLSRVCDKLHVSNPLELVLYALHYQLVNDD